jgi:hypothetical protein
MRMICGEGRTLYSSKTSIEPEGIRPASTATEISDAYGLGEALESSFVARGAMGSGNRIVSLLRGELRRWTVKRRSSLPLMRQRSRQAIALLTAEGSGLTSSVGHNGTFPASLDCQRNCL